jgi:hypothetical protein
MKLVVSIIILCSVFTVAQIAESLEKEAADILVSLSVGTSISTDDFANLNEILRSDSTASMDSLSKHLNQFESELNKISIDSAFVLFNQWYLHLNNVFYDYNKEKFFSSDKTKILLFSTSMSCYCTLEMCKNQTVELLKFIHENNYGYDYWVVDSYWYNELQIKYETFFAPSVIVFGSDNQLLHKIEYEKKMISLLSYYLTNVER